ncbi:MAG: DNA topoisomerase 3 [Acidobacteria bacterium]|nr:DNA topoisomerase 3 [Acidobacteriota bacterium]
MSDADSKTIAVLAEKPSVARDIARVLGADKKGEGYLHGNGYVVTWAIGHLAALAQPAEINPSWRQWRRDTLPMLPSEWPLVVYDKTKDQFETVRKIVNSPKVAQIVCATDAGREGELIFRYIYEAAHCTKPCARLWISSLTPDAIRKGFDSLKPSTEYDPLADAARGRSRADWLVGMNLSRAYSLAFNEDLSVGRVQTPTLAMLVERELTVRNFVPEDYYEVVATFQPKGRPETDRYEGTWFRDRPANAADHPANAANKESLQQSMRLPADGEEAKRIAARALTGQAAIESIKSETQRMPPLPLYDLTELQRHANRLYGYSAQQTLDIAQALYERHKLISYPRTDSRHLSQDVAQTLLRVTKAIESPYHPHIAPGTGQRPLGRRFVDDAKVTDHHAIIPTPTTPNLGALSTEEHRLYDLVCRRLLSAWHDDHIYSTTTVITAIRNPDIIDRYHTSGTAVDQLGWKVLDIAPPKKAPKKGDAKGKATTEEQAGQTLPPGLQVDQPQDVIEAEAVKKKTRAPKRFTEGTLLTAMETAGKTLDEKELSDAMKETGLGTPATRASIIEVLLKRQYILRNGKSLEATDKGIRLIEVVHPEVKSPAMTGQWEAHLQRIHRGKAELTPFLKGIEQYVTEVVGKVGQTKAPPRNGPSPAPQRAADPEPVSAPKEKPEVQPGDTPESILHRAFGFSSFRPNQEAVCKAAIEGNDVLLVMPTGSGKSLCYQLPGIARGGTTLVISPLIALMEDQVAKLKEYGFAVERIHSGRDRGASRQACIDYLAGRLQFLFIAPERLRVSGFPEMLAKRKPTLIAIDEAHCISQWGHDFRPDYRMFGQYLPSLRPTPVMALTATATPLVQDDICRQLDLGQASRFIHGFRRDNLAIEVVEVAPSQRGRLAEELLEDDDRRPAIIYAPTRKQVDTLTHKLRGEFSTAAYHAGLDSDHRKRVQEQFLNGQVEVMIATIAFGMGIDKPNIRTVIHTALPGSMEAYYQEIGRAGRDGKPSRAVLMHSYADRYTHDFFFERDYPDAKILEGIYSRLRETPIEKEVLQQQSRLGSDEFDKALEKLWIHGGAIIDYAENVTIGAPNWKPSYLAHGEQKSAQIELMIRYAETNQCRMATLVRHFGDVADGRTNCGICDFCAPTDCAAQAFRPAMPQEAAVARKVAVALVGGEQRSTGKLHTEVCPRGELIRDQFEELLGAMARAGFLRLADAVFEKDGRQIPYRTARLTGEGRRLVSEATPLELILKEAVAAPSKRKRKKKAAAKTTSKSKPRAAAAPKQAPSQEEAPAPANESTSALEKALKAWRLEEAKRKNVPAFRIFSDQALHAIAQRRPATASELVAIPGLGIRIAEKYGHQIYRILSQHSH